MTTAFLSTAAFFWKQTTMTAFTPFVIICLWPILTSLYNEIKRKLYRGHADLMTKTTGQLVVIATPIGNLGDWHRGQRRCLSADILACEAHA